MRFPVALPAVLLLLSIVRAGPVGEDQRTVLTLREAAESGRLGVRGVDPGSYREITLELENQSDEALLVDLCGSHLRPKKKGSCQRLGLGPAITPHVTGRRGPGTVVVELEPRARLSLRMSTVCLDAGRSSPSKQVFVAATSSLPPVREKVLRWWADHPEAPQSAVNAAIWNFREEVRVSPGIVPGYGEPRGKYPAARGGTYYRLQDGELRSFDAEGVERVLGTQIFTVLPAEGAVYAVGLGGDGRPELWRLAMTGEEPWGKVARLDISSRVLEVHPMADRKVVLVTDQGVRVVDPESGSTRMLLGAVQQKNLTVSRASSSVLLVAARVPASDGFWQGGERKGESSDVFELWAVDAEADSAKQLKRFWNVKDMAAGPAGVYGLTHKGLLRRLAGESFKTMSAARVYDRILAVGRKAVWLVNSDGGLEAADASSGHRRFVTSVKAGEDFNARIDAVTDDLAFVDPEDGGFRRAVAADGRIEAIGAGD